MHLWAASAAVVTLAAAGHGPFLQLGPSPTPSATFALKGPVEGLPGEVAGSRLPFPHLHILDQLGPSVCLWSDCARACLCVYTWMRRGSDYAFLGVYSLDGCKLSLLTAYLCRPTLCPYLSLVAVCFHLPSPWSSHLPPYSCLPTTQLCVYVAYVTVTLCVHVSPGCGSVVLAWTGVCL